MKKERQLARMRSMIANTQVQLSIAAYTKVNIHWKQMNFVSDFNRFYYITEGEGCLEIGGAKYYPRPGQLVVMPGGIPQSYYSINDNTFTKYWCHFTSNIGDLNLFQVLDLPYFIEVGDPKQLTSLFQSLINHSQSRELSSALMQKAVLLEIISLYIDQTVQGNYELQPLNEDSQIHKIDTVMRYMERNIHRSLTVQEMAEQIHFHPHYFIRFFHELVGLSPIQYVRKLKMDRSMYVLTATDKPVSEIASEVGMELYYFSRIFKKHTGLSPTEYRAVFPSLQE